TLTCSHCHTSGAHPLSRAVTKFSLFFIPLFPVRSEYLVQCTCCGATSRLSKDRAEALRDQARHPAGGRPNP
ncbi:MAG: zinc-ribbon domain-containing protein, partial [Pseudonocardia sp.]|nr:zinc-ribbon domain-containing protein [Pseudonocardia sp.]